MARVIGELGEAAAINAHHIDVDVFRASIVGVRGTQNPLSVGRNRRCGKATAFLAHDDGLFAFHIVDAPNFIMVLRVAAHAKELFVVDGIR